MCYSSGNLMATTTEHRKLAAIMFTDMVGYSALAQRNEALALELLEEHRHIVRDLLPQHGGREVKTAGDGFLIEFPSALAAVQAAVAIQDALHARNQVSPPERQVKVRIGIHVGDVVVSAGDIHGDGVNIAARIEPLAPPGGICVSNAVFEQVRNKLEQPIAALGPAELKNIELPVVVHRVVMAWESGSVRLPAGRRRGIARAGLVAGLVLLALVAVTALWQPWRKARSFSATVSATQASPATADAAHEPLLRARDICVKGSDASREELKLAISLCQSAIERDRSKPEAWALLARLNCNLYDDYDRTAELLNAAEAAARNALSLAPSSVAARLAQASVYALQTATCSQSLEILRRLEREAPNDPDVLVALGGRLLFATDVRAPAGETDNAEALKLFDRALALRPGDPMALDQKAWALSFAGKAAEADAVWNESIHRTGSASALVARFYDLANNRGQVEEAKALLAQFPPDLVFNDLAVRVVTYFWLVQHEPAKALAFVQPFPRDFLEDHFVEVPKGYLAGKAYSQMGDLAAARLAWQNALEVVNRRLTLKSEEPRLIQSKACLLYLLGEAGEAAKQAELYQQLTRLDDPQTALVGTLTMWMEMGRVQDAVSLIRHNRKSLSAIRLRHYAALFPAVGSSPEFKAELARVEAAEQADKGRAVDEQTGGAGPQNTNAVAVLPFVNTSADKDNEYFSDGVSDEILNALGGQPVLAFVPVLQRQPQ